MGKKYIIEIEDKPFHKGNGDFLYRVKGFNSLVFDMTGIGMLTPYTEPDLEQIRKEAYEEGYKKCLSLNNFGHLCVSCDKYEQGLADAWDAARKVTQVRKYGGYGDCLSEVFGRNDTTWDVFDYSATEAIEKIQQYEQRQEELIQIGDEVTIRDKTAVVTEITDRYVRIMYSDGSCYALFSKGIVKTGRHFPEIAAVLAEMKEADNG